ncbi:MAG: GNAT family N-acetyltransferase [Mesorhizobium sp.]|nr:MAG: GNAT family N-acetyltransferase [Mesorhizobium sp.]TIX26238.1 MAG: GNAT family N-acetyltransferase [Mesorhizobium sp.]
MHQPTIEPMGEPDVAAVAQLRLATFFEGTERTLEEDAAGLRDLLGGDGFEAALVARIDDTPVGTCLLVRHELEPAHDLTPWLAGLVVGAMYRRRGIATALVKATEAHAASQGVETLYLYTWDARAFYAALGWNTVEIFGSDGERMALMSRRLGNMIPKGGVLVFGKRPGKQRTYNLPAR